MKYNFDHFEPTSTQFETLQNLGLSDDPDLFVTVGGQVYRVIDAESVMRLCRAIGFNSKCKAAIRAKGNDLPFITFYHATENIYGYEIE